jgi:Leucine-rich repeat (LRR) protein
MKKIILIVLLTLSMATCYTQTRYIIQKIDNGYDILVIISNSNKQNELLIDSILQDPLYSKCISMNIAGDFEKLPNNFQKLPFENIKNLQIQSKSPFVINSLFNYFLNLESLLCFSKIKRIDENVVFSKVTSIWFQYADLTEFPKAICNWTSLKNIDIQSCSFSVIPKEIGALQNLERLNFSNDKIKELPYEFYSLKKLKSIGLSDNKLQDISFEICNFENLEFICWDNNKNLKLDKKVYECLKEKIYSTASPY